MANTNVPKEISNVLVTSASGFITVAIYIMLIIGAQ
jgi:hypothetical protein